MAVPSNKVNSILEIIPIGPCISRAIAILLPCFITSLCVSIRGRRAGTGEDPQTTTAGWSGIGSESRLMMDNGHQDRYGDTPPLVGPTRTPIPFWIFPEDLTEIGDRSRRGCGSTPVKKHEDKTAKKYRRKFV